MAKRITDLTELTTVTGGDYLPIVDVTDITDSAQGTTKKINTTHLLAGVQDATITTTDITTNNVSTSKHGFAPKLPGNTTTFLRGDGAYAAPSGAGGGTWGSITGTLASQTDLQTQLSLAASKQERHQRGVALSGLEFAASTLPGVEGTNYFQVQEADVAYFAKKGFTLFRLPFLWERLQTTLNGSLNATYLGYLDNAVTLARKYGMKIVLDCHNYGRYSISGTTHVIGDGTLTAAHLADMWSRLATHFAQEDTIFAYDLMNEPHDLPVPTTSANYNTTATWTLAAQAAITAIRAVDTTHWILAETDNWSGLAAFTSSYGTNPTWWLSDTANKTMLSLHYYQDADHSGSYVTAWSSTLRSNIPTDVLPALQWAEANNLRVYIGEYGVPNGTTSDALNWQADMDTVLGYFDAYGVFATHWAAGNFYTSTTTLQPFTNSTSDYNKENEQMAIVKKHLGNGTRKALPQSKAATITIGSSTAKDTTNYDYLCSGTSDEVVINNAIAALPTSGGRIILSEGIFNLGAPIAISSSYIAIEGQGAATQLKMQNSANALAAISITGTGTVQYSVKRLRIEGNSANQTNGNGINVNTPWQNATNKFDPNGVFEDIFINDVKNNGFAVTTSSDTRVMHLTRVRIRGAQGNAFYLPAPSCTDSIFTDCIAETAALNGFYVGCLNSHFINCKVFYCGSTAGSNHGFNIVGYNNYFDMCEAQDNYQSGFYGDGTAGDATYHNQYNTFINCIGDSNNQAANASYGCGMQLVNCKGWQIIGGVYMTRPYPDFTQRVGIQLQGTTDQTFIQGAILLGNTTNYVDSSSGTNYPLGINGYASSQLPGKLVVQGQIRASGGFLQSDPQTLTAGATVSTDASTGNTFYLTAAQNFTLANPTNQADGQTCKWFIAQDSTGSRILTLGTKFDTGPFTVTLTTTASKTDMIEATYKASADKWYITNFQKGY